MAYLVKKTIKGKDYHYIAKSVRLPNGKVASLRQAIPKPSGKKADIIAKHERLLEKAEKKVFKKYAIGHFASNTVFTETQLKKIEDLRVEYNLLMKGITKEDKKDLFDRFTANFTYESDAIEGSSLTLKDVELVLFQNRIPKDADLREVYEARNSRQVLNKILGKKLKITEKDTKKIHSLLMQNIDERKGYKKLPNIVLGSNLKTVSPENVEKEMEKLFRWFDENKDKLSPLMLSAHFHGKFEKIHPFADGNGRVGRWLSAAILANNDYPPLIIRKTQRQAYYKTLNDFDRGYATNLERFFLDKYKNTYKNFFKMYYDYL